MSLNLLEAVKNHKIRHRPNDTLKLRIGIHTGDLLMTNYFRHSFYARVRNLYVKCFVTNDFFGIEKHHYSIDSNSKKSLKIDCTMFFFVIRIFVIRTKFII